MADLKEYCSRPFLLLARIIQWLPVLFISGILTWSYYAYVVELNLSLIKSVPQKAIYLSLYHFLFAMLIWSYCRTIFTESIDIPATWKLTSRMNERLKSAKSEEDWKTLLELFVVEMQLPVSQCSVQGAIRYCEKCQIIKPDRSHHCSICETCVKKMDHHCPWVNNCVAFNNYKFFLLFLGYALTYCLFVAATTFQYFLKFWTHELDSTGSGKFHIFFLLLVAVLFFMSVSSLFWYHVYLVLKNRTTLEQFRAPHFRNHGQDEKGWNLGKRNNFEEVFGSRKAFWFFPVFTSLGDGLVYPTRFGRSTIDPENGNKVNKIATEVVLNQESNHLVRIVTND